MFTAVKEKLRVLCIDDEASFLDLTKEFLEEGGCFQVSTALSAEEGLQVWREGDFDAIVCDYDMPAMDGITLLQIVRGTPSSTPFIIFTGRGREEVAIEALNSGADSYLQKGGQARAQFFELSSKIDQAVRRRRAEEALVRSEELFRGMAERSSDVTMLLDTDLSPIYVSSSIERLSGFKPEELVGRPLEQLGMHPEDLARMQAANAAGLDPSSEDVIIRLSKKDGGTLHLEIRATPIVQGGNFTGLQIEGRNVSERFNLHHQLMESERHYRLLAENIKDVVWLLDFETGRFLYVSPSVEALRGFTPEEVMAEPMEASLTEGSLEIIGERVGQAYDEFMTENGKASFFTVELEQPCKDGGTVITEVVTSFHRNQNTGRIEVIGVSRDIGKRRAAQDALREANRRLSVLNSITRHDLLDQLMVLRGHLEHDTRAASPDLKVRLDRISDIARNMERLLILTRDYQEMGVEKPQWQPLTHVLMRAVAQLDLGAVVLDEELGETEILADPLLERVFFNLLNNSLRNGGNVSIIHMTKRMDGEDMVLVQEDDGVGIPEAKKAAVFERGVGGDMGLFLAKEVLSLTGIGLRETGIPGSGACFEMTVPKDRFRN